MENKYLIIFGAIFLLLVLIVIIVTVSKKKKPKIEPISNEFLETLYIALGTNKNIKSIDIEHQRIRLVLNEVKDVDAKKLQELSIPAFLKGKELKILVKHHTKEVYRYINERRAN